MPRGRPKKPVKKVYQNTVVAFRLMNPIRVWNESMQDHGQWVEVEAMDWVVFKRVAERLDIRFIELDTETDWPDWTSRETYQ